MDIRKIYLAYKAEESHAIQEKLLKEGKWTYLPPLGYAYERIGSRRRGHSNLIVDEGKAAIVRRIFELYACNIYAIDEIKKRVFEEFGYKMTRSNIYTILDNPFYNGIMVKKGKQYPHYYPRIIEQSLWDKVHEIRTTSNKNNVKRFNVKPLVFRALLTCYECGCAITSESQKGYTYYHCTRSKGKHNAPWVKEDDLAVLLKDYAQKTGYTGKLETKEQIRIACGTLYKKLYLHENKSLSHEVYTSVPVVQKPVALPQDSLANTIRILLHMPHSIEELMLITQQDMITIQTELITMQLDGLIEQDELGNWKQV